jgi:ribonuclease III
MRSDPATLETAIGYRFSDRTLFERALTHRSGSHESVNHQSHNEQLEFLGDSVLGFVVSEALVRQFPSHREGALSELKAHLVSSAYLYHAALKLDLGAYLELGKGEEQTGGRAKRRLLVNALEALIAALYLDGGMEPVRAFIERFVVTGKITPPDHLDFKGELQEFVQSRGMAAPRYVTVQVCGPEHAKTFRVEVRVGAEWKARGEGSSKKAASQKAAQALFERIKETAAEAEGSG